MHIVLSRERVVYQLWHTVGYDHLPMASILWQRLSTLAYRMVWPIVYDHRLLWLYQWLSTLAYCMVWSLVFGFYFVTAVIRILLSSRTVLPLPGGSVSGCVCLSYLSYLFLCIRNWGFWNVPAAGYLNNARDKINVLYIWSNIILTITLLQTILTSNSLTFDRIWNILLHLFIWALISLSTLQIISWWVVLLAEESSTYVTCHFKTFGRFETVTAVLIPLQGLETAWPFRNGQLFLLAVLIPHQFDISGQVSSVAFKRNSCNTIKTYIFIRTAFSLLWNIYRTKHTTTFISAYKNFFIKSIVINMYQY